MSRKSFLALFALALIYVSCKQVPSKQTDERELFNVSAIRSAYGLDQADTLYAFDCNARIWRQKERKTIDHGLLVVTAKTGDTLLTYFNDAYQIRMMVPFRYGNDYFLYWGGNFSERPEYFNSQHLLHINPATKSIEKNVAELDMDIFRNYIKKRVDTTGLKELPLRFTVNRTKAQPVIKLIYTVSKDSLNGAINYIVETPMLINKTSAGFAVGAKPDKMIKKTPDPDDGAQQVNSLNNPIGILKGVELFYDCLNCSSTMSEDVRIFAKKNGKRTDLATIQIADMYVSDAVAFSKNGGDFVYINSDHTYGHSQGYLYSIDLKNLHAYRVNQIESYSKAPDTLEPWKFFGLQRDEKGDFYSGETYHSHDEDSGYKYSETRYDLVKVRGNIFLLMPKKSE